MNFYNWFSQPTGVLRVGFGLVLFFSVLCLYCGIINPPPLGYYTTDENFIAETGVFMLYGITPRALEWPALLSSYLYFIVFLCQCAYEILTHLSQLSGISSLFDCIDRVAHFYLTHRSQYVVVGRVLQLILAVGFSYRIIRFLAFSAHPMLAGWGKVALVVCFGSAFWFWGNAAIIRPEMLVSLLFFEVVIRLLFASDAAKPNLNLVMVLFALCLSQRLLLVFMVPFVVGSLAWYAFRYKNAKLFWSGAGSFFATILVAIPYLITDLMVILKSFFGGIVNKMNVKAPKTLFNEDFIVAFFSNPVNVFFAILFLMGLFYLFKRQLYGFAALLLLVNIFLFWFSALRSPQVYSTHFLPTSVACLPFVGFGVVFLLTLGNTKKLLGIRYFVLSVPFWLGLYEFMAFQKAAHQHTNFHEAQAWVIGLEANSKIALDPEYEEFIPKNKVCLLREQQQNNDPERRIVKIRKILSGVKNDMVDFDKLPVIARSFAFEDEELAEVQYRLRLKFYDASKPAFDVYYMLNDINLANHAVQRDSVIAALRANSPRYDYFVSVGGIAELKPFKVFDTHQLPNVFVYKRTQ